MLNLRYIPRKILIIGGGLAFLSSIYLIKGCARRESSLSLYERNLNALEEILNDEDFLRNFRESHVYRNEQGNQDNYARNDEIWNSLEEKEKIEVLERALIYRIRKTGRDIRDWSRENLDDMVNSIFGGQGGQNGGN